MSNISSILIRHSRSRTCALVSTTLLGIAEPSDPAVFEEVDDGYRDLVVENAAKKRKCRGVRTDYRARLLHNGGRVLRRASVWPVRSAPDSAAARWIAGVRAQP